MIKIKQEVDEKILQALLESDQIPERLAYYNEKIYHAKFNDWLRWDLNGTWSKNRIKNYVGYVYDESLVNGEIVDDLYTQTAIEGGNTPIAFSPSFIGNSLITLGSNGLEIALQSQYVSRQYLDNFGTKENSLERWRYFGFSFRDSRDLCAVRKIL